MKRKIIVLGLFVILISLLVLAGCSSNCNHEFDTNASCQDAVCNKCGYIRKATTKHSFDSSFTCIDRFCKSCGNVIKATTDHSYTEVVTDPTCETEGFTTYTCSCGDTYTGKKTDKISHSVSDWEVTLNPTCSSFGTREGVCEYCKKTIQEKISKTSHEYTETSRTEATCSNAGEIVYTCSCGDSYIDTIPPLKHTPSGDGKVHNPTCTEKGYTEYTCEVCHETYKQDYVDCLGHKMVNVENIASCENSSYVGEKCSVCGYTEYTYGNDRLVHSYNENGYCKECFGYYTETPSFTLNGGSFYQTYENDKFRIEIDPDLFKNGGKTFTITFDSETSDEYLKAGYDYLKFYFTNLEGQAVTFTSGETIGYQSLGVSSSITKGEDVKFTIKIQCTEDEEWLKICPEEVTGFYVRVSGGKNFSIDSKETWVESSSLEIVYDEDDEYIMTGSKEENHTLYILKFYPHIHTVINLGTGLH